MTDISRILRLKWFAKTMPRKILPIGLIFFFLCGYISEVGAQNHVVDGEYITDWLLLGPFFPDYLRTDFLADVGGEVNIDPKAGDTVITPKGETLTWKRYQTKSGFVNLRHAVGNHQPAIAYAFCTLESETEGRIQTLVGSDDGVAVWINGKRVHHNPAYRPLVLDEDAFEANLQAGDNRCLVKVSQGYGSWSFSMRVFPSGQPVLITPKFSLSADNLADGNHSIPLSATEWKYHPGDDLSWAHPQFDDSSWESVNTLLPSHGPPQSGWHSIGWFRLHLAVDTTLLSTPLALSIWQVGASEIYLDGNRLYQFGVIGQSKAEEKGYLQREPKAISFGDSGDHLLAVRYSNFTANTFGAKIHRSGSEDNTGFAVSLTDLNRAVQRRISQFREGKTHQIFLTSVFSTVGFLHLLLFLFNRQSTVNLYYAISIICFAVGIFCNFHLDFFSTTPAQLGGALIGFAGGMVAAMVFGLFTIYSELYAKLPRRSYVFLSIGTSLMVWLYIQPGPAIRWILYLFFLVFLMEFIRSKIAADKRSGNSVNKVGRRIINFGFAIFVLTSIYQVVIDLNLMNPIGGLYLPFFFYGFLCLIVCRSIELTRNFARTSIDNARKTQELEEARQLQRLMLPQTPPILPNIEIAWEMKTANEVGGDYYDFSLAADGTLTVAIGDVTGHGLNAGIVVATAKGLFNTSAHAFSHSLTLKTISQGIKAMNLRRLYMAMTLATLKDNQLTITAAGMPPALIYRVGEQRVAEVLLEGMPLGSLIGVGYQHKTFELQPGDTVLLMSDGLPERLNPDDDILDYPKTKALFEAVGNNTPAEIIAHLFKAGEAWANGRPQDDDVTFVVMKVR